MYTIIKETYKSSEKWEPSLKDSNHTKFAGSREDDAKSVCKLIVNLCARIGSICERVERVPKAWVKWGEWEEKRKRTMVYLPTL